MCYLFFFFLVLSLSFFFFFFFNDTATTEIYTLSLHDALPILDIPLADVRRLLNFTSRPDEDCADINRLVDEQIARVRARLTSLKALERQLTTLRARCSAGHQAKECGILGELVSAAQREA